MLQNCLRSWRAIDIAVYLTKSFTNNTFPKSINSLFSQGSLSSNSGTFPPFQVHQCLPILPLAKTTFSCSVCHSWIYMWNIIQKTHLKLPGCIFFLSQIVTYHVNIGSNVVKFLCFSEKNPYCIVSKTLLHSLSPHLREHWGPSMEASSPLSRFKLLLSLPEGPWYFQICPCFNVTLRVSELHMTSHIKSCISDLSLNKSYSIMH